MKRTQPITASQMASPCASFFITLLGWYSIIETYLRRIVRSMYRFGTHVIDYFHHDHAQWRIYPDHAVPVAYHRKKRTFGPLTGHWLYDPSHNRMLGTDRFSGGSTKTYRIGWLSAEIEIETATHKKHVYSMDSFLETFTFNGYGSLQYPTLSELFLAWCIYHGQWFDSVLWIRIHVIDEHANEHEYRMGHSLQPFQPLQERLHLTPTSSASTSNKKIDDNRQRT